jgi:hypothetical protein
MEQNFLRPTSVGSLVKKITAINPALGVPEIIAIVREATIKKPEGSYEFGTSEVIDEKLALELARAIPPGKPKNSNPPQS